MYYHKIILFVFIYIHFFLIKHTFTFLLQFLLNKERRVIVSRNETFYIRASRYSFTEVTGFYRNFFLSFLFRLQVLRLFKDHVIATVKVKVMNWYTEEKRNVYVGGKQKKHLKWVEWGKRARASVCFMRAGNKSMCWVTVT